MNFEHVFSERLCNAYMQSDEKLLSEYRAIRSEFPSLLKSLDCAFLDVAYFAVDSELSQLSNLAQRIIRIRDKTDVKRQLLIDHNFDLEGVELVDKSGEYGAFFSKETYTGEESKVRVSLYSCDGFHTHYSRDNYSDLLDKLFEIRAYSEFKGEIPLLEQFSRLESFHAGNEATTRAKVREFNWVNGHTG